MKKIMKRLFCSFLTITILTSLFSISAFAKTTRDYDIFTTNSKGVVSTKIDYFDVGGNKTCYIYANSHGYPVVPKTVYSQGVASELELLNKALYFDYWVADKNNEWVSGGTVRLGGKIKTPSKGKRIYITTRIEPSKGNFVKKNNALYAQSLIAKKAAIDGKYYVKY
ncbi:MAG: hypothetical protein ACI4TH_02790 [Candidatus Ornithomonoglobus sp.]